MSIDGGVLQGGITMHGGDAKKAETGMVEDEKNGECVLWDGEW